MSYYQKKTPILFLIFNRPDITEKVFNEIRKAKPRKLFLAADGPKENNVNDQKLCYLTRKIVKKVDWKCQVFTNFKDKNLGCKLAISSAIDWFFKSVDYGIILEDDCFPNQSFFWFCQELLEKYQDNKRVMQISGNNFLFNQKEIKTSYYFSKINDIWGWATWKRAWKAYDLKMTDFLWYKQQKYIYKYLKNKKIANWLMSYFEEAYQDRNSTKGIWSSQWSYAMAKHNGLTIVPKTNLVENIGIGEKATHSGKSFSLYTKAQKGEIDQLVHPKKVIVDEQADRLRFNIICQTDPRLKKGYHKNQLIKKIINKFRFLKK